MREKDLHQLIDELNVNQLSPKFLIKEIAQNIYFGNVWHQLPWEDSQRKKGEEFYLIKRPNNGFIGIIAACSHEMYVYLKPEFRGLGIMSNALRKTIIPHLFSNLKTEKLILSIDYELYGQKFNRIEKSAIMAGFKKKKIKGKEVFEYIACKEDFPEFNDTSPLQKLSVEDEIKFFHERTNSIKYQLQYLKERYDLFFNEEDELISKIKQSIDHFESNYENKLRLSI